MITELLDAWVDKKFLSAGYSKKIDSWHKVEYSKYLDGIGESNILQLVWIKDSSNEPIFKSFYSIPKRIVDHNHYTDFALFENCAVPGNILFLIWLKCSCKKTLRERKMYRQ